MPANPLKPLNPKQFDFRKARHLLNRAGFGGSPDQISALANMGLEAAVHYIVHYHEIKTEPVEADRFDHDIMKPRAPQQQKELQRARREGDEAILERFRKERQQRQRRDRRQLADLQSWWLQRMIETPRPLEEKMTLFWHGHFATGYRAIQDSYHLFRQNQFFRANATGNFRNLVQGIIRDPAMIRYLNNNQNRRQAPNENLARELMELFTLGEGHDYTEHDIKEGARALTGYTFQDDDFIFRPRLHDRKSKTILGQKGFWDGDDFVNIILSRDVASEYLCFKLHRYFVNDAPAMHDTAPQAKRYILAMAKLFRERDYDLSVLLQTMFTSEYFYDDSNIRHVIKSPVQLVVQAIRTLHTPVRSLKALLDACSLMGQNIFNPPSVKGWEGGVAWINTSSLFMRQNVLVYLLTGRRPNDLPWDTDLQDYDAMPIIAHLRDAQGLFRTDEVLAYLLKLNLGDAPHAQRMESLKSLMNEHRGDLDNPILIALLCLITSMPEYQLM
ncbi:MAG: DUF1800 domain-containing protein [Planctomycetota bacterium]|nr:DUF1800 domain-containing protein [Planctomycetota bacterium]